MTVSMTSSCVSTLAGSSSGRRRSISTRALAAVGALSVVAIGVVVAVVIAFLVVVVLCMCI